MRAMKGVIGLLAILLLASGSSRAADQAKILSEVKPLPVALSPDFEFRKTKLFLLTERAPRFGKSRASTDSIAGSARSNPGVADAAIKFERQYRLFGAVTALDQRERFGNYFDFFWRGQRDVPVTVRLEYRQEALRSFVQAREISYPSGRGSHKTEFAIIGDAYADDGRVIAWRCLLIAEGKIAAIKRSYLWK